MKDYIQIGIEKGLISLNEDRSWITYGYQKKERKVFLHMKCVRDTAMLRRFCRSAARLILLS